MEIFKKKNRFRLLSHIILVIVTVMIAIPFYILFVASLTDNDWAIVNGFTFWPKKWSLVAYQYLLSQLKMFGKAYLITICVTVSGVVISVTITAMCAYMLAQRDLPGRNIITFFIIFTMLFNGGMVASYINYTQVFHLKNTYLAYLIPNYLCSAMNIILVRSYYMSAIPHELLESARIDGASEMKCFIRIVLPLSKPILATIALLTGIMYWNDWQNGAYYINDNSMLGIQNILNNINNNTSYMNYLARGAGGTPPTITMRLAIAVIGILPLMIAYPFFQKYFVKGITLGAVKG